MISSIYVLSALTSLACAWLLLRGYARSHQSLLLWGGLCFAGLTIDNALVFADLVMLPHLDLYLLRLVVGTIALGVLVFGLVWEAQ